MLNPKDRLRASAKSPARSSASKAPAPGKKASRKKRSTKKKAASADFAAELIEASSIKGVTARLAHDAEALADVKEWIPTGFPGLDEIFGGGWHVGRISEVFGAEASGKSALAHRAIVACQQNGGYVIYYDVERSLEKRIFRQLGIDPKRLVYLTPDYIEQATDSMVHALDRLVTRPPDAPVLIVYDSVGASQPKAAFEAEAGEAQPGAKARAIGHLANQLYGRVADARAHVMLVNQERTVFGGSAGWGGPSLETTGGKSAKYAFALRVRCVRVATVKKGGTSGPATGYLIKVITKKNKCAPPHQQATWYLDFKHGPSPELTMYHVLKDANRIRSAGGGVYTGPWAGGQKFGKGDAWLTALKDDGFRAKAEEAYLEVVRAGGARALLDLESREDDDE